jgi:hypothetical protein
MADVKQEDAIAAIEAHIARIEARLGVLDAKEIEVNQQAANARTKRGVDTSFSSFLLPMIALAGSRKNIRDVELAVAHEIAKIHDERIALTSKQADLSAKLVQINSNQQKFTVTTLRIHLPDGRVFEKLVVSPLGNQQFSANDALASGREVSRNADSWLRQHRYGRAA